MNKQSILIFLLLFSVCSAFAQSNKLDKRMEKINDLFEKGKTEEADKQMVELLKENPTYGAGWDYLSRLRYKEFTDAKDLKVSLGDTKVEVKNEKGGQGNAPDSLVDMLTKMLNDFSPSKMALEKFKHTVRKATLLSNEAVAASYMLRATFVDEEVDTAINRKALKYYNEAEAEFAKKNYTAAAKSYKRALDEQPGFYKASLYMGDCFYYAGNYLSAISSFKSAVERFPNQLEPRKYLVDAYAKEGLYDKALDEAVLGMTVYPDLSMVMKLEDAAFINNKKIDIKWTGRGVFPNKMVKNENALNINLYTDPDSLVAKEPWTHYADALGKIKMFCDDKGMVVKPTKLTNSPYMEVYSWEHMLANSTDPSLDEARRMQKDGYLDCYVLVTCFHYDFYDQYLDFVTANKEKVVEYYNKYMVSN